MKNSPQSPLLTVSPCIAVMVLNTQNVWQSSFEGKENVTELETFCVMLLLVLCMEA